MEEKLERHGRIQVRYAEVWQSEPARTAPSRPSIGQRLLARDRRLKIPIRCRSLDKHQTSNFKHQTSSKHQSPAVRGQRSGTGKPTLRRKPPGPRNADIRVGLTDRSFWPVRLGCILSLLQKRGAGVSEGLEAEKPPDLPTGKSALRPPPPRNADIPVGRWRGFQPRVHHQPVPQPSNRAKMRPFVWNLVFGACLMFEV